jgi:hypothetical protein
MDSPVWFFLWGNMAASFLALLTVSIAFLRLKRSVYTMSIWYVALFQLCSLFNPDTATGMKIKPRLRRPVD